MPELVAAVLGVLLIAVSQLLFKSAAARGRGVRGTLLQVPIAAGLAINGVAAVLWVFALRRLELSFVFPLLSLNYLTVPLGARWLFGERIGRRRAVAIVIIVCGVALCLLAG